MKIKCNKSRKSVKGADSRCRSLMASTDKDISYRQTGGTYYFTKYDVYVGDKLVGKLEHHNKDVKQDYYVAWITKNGNYAPWKGDWETKSFDSEDEAVDWILSFQNNSIDSSCSKKSVKSSRNVRHRAIKSSKAPRRHSKIMAGPGAGYTIEWELDNIRKVNSFDVTDVSKPDKWGTVTVTADCDIDIDVTIKSAWSYMYGFNTPIEGVSAKIYRVVFDYNISDNYGDLLNFEDYEDLTDDVEYINEVNNAMYQLNEMEAMNILEDDAWDTIRGAEFTYGGGYVHSTWDGTLLEVDKYNYADIQVTDSAVVEYVDRAVSGETVYSDYTVFINGDATGYNYETEEEAINEAKAYIESGEYEGDIADTYVERTDWVEYFNGDTDFVDSEIVWNAFDEYEND